MPDGDGGAGGVSGVVGNDGEEEGAGGVHKRGDSCSTSSSPSSLSSFALHCRSAAFLVPLLGGGEAVGDGCGGGASACSEVVQAVAVAPHSSGEVRRSCYQWLLAACWCSQLRS
jgi:hypothetical protein